MSAVLINAALGSAITLSTIGTSNTLNFASATGTPGVGDLVVVLVTIRGTAGTVNTPSGWNLLTNAPYQYTAQNNRMYVFWRVRAAGDANSVTLTSSGGAANNTALIQAYYFGGVDPVNPIDVTPVKTDQAASATVVGPLTAATTATNGALAVAFWHRADDAGTFSTASSGWTHNAATGAVVTSALGTDAAMGMATKTVATAGTTGTYQLDVSGGTSVTGMGIIFALKPQTGSGLVQLTAEGYAGLGSPQAQSTSDPYLSIVSGNGSTSISDAWAAPNLSQAKSYAHSVTSTTNQRIKCNADIPSTRQYGAFIGRFTTVPSGATRIASLEAYDGTDHAQVQMNASGQFRITSNANGVIVGPSTAAYTINNDFRVEWKYDNGNAELRIFLDADLDNDVSSPTETLSSSSFPTGGIVGRGMYGSGTSWGGSGGTLYYDMCSIREDNWVNLKPSSPKPKPVIVVRQAITNAATW